MPIFSSEAKTMPIAPRNSASIPSLGDSSDAISVGFSILGVGIRLEGRPAADIYPVTQLYADFREAKVSPSWTIKWDGGSSPTRMTVNEEVYDGLSGKWISPLISMKVMDCVYRTTKDFFLFHGAAAAWRDVLLAFPGESGAGKSSLSVALASEGWSLFSDELIPVSRKNLHVLPFRRAITIRSTDPVSNDFLPAEGHSTEFMPLVGGGSKTIISFLFSRKPPSPFPLKAIVCLRGWRGEMRGRQRQIVVTHWDKRMENLAREKGVYGNLHVRRVGQFWRIRSDRVVVVEDICTSLGGIVIERGLVEDSPPAFGKTPLLEPISPFECLNVLWSVFQNGRSLTNGGGGTLGLYLQLAQIAKAIPCFSLRPGPPAPTCELLKKLAEKLAKRDVSRE